MLASAPALVPAPVPRFSFLCVRAVRASSRLLPDGAPPAGGGCRPRREGGDACRLGSHSALVCASPLLLLLLLSWSSPLPPPLVPKTLMICNLRGTHARPPGSTPPMGSRLESLRACAPSSFAARARSAKRMYLSSITSADQPGTNLGGGAGGPLARAWRGVAWRGMAWRGVAWHSSPAHAACPLPPCRRLARCVW